MYVCNDKAIKELEEHIICDSLEYRLHQLNLECLVCSRWTLYCSICRVKSDMTRYSTFLRNPNEYKQAFQQQSYYSIRFDELSSRK